MIRAARALAGGAALVVALLAALASPAAADPPQPTNFRSEVTGATPPLPRGVTATVVGGDSFLELTVARGIEVVVPDYGEDAVAGAVPYLRFEADGTVRRNDRSTARAANEQRYGTSRATPSPDAEPRWTVVARDGRYAWHDHRIHWMSPTPPRVVADDGTVDLGGPEGRWEVPLLVDGVPVTVTGQLVLEPAPSPLPWLAVGLVVGAGAVVFGRRWPRRLVVASAAVAALAVAVSVARWLDAPAGAGATPIAAVVAALGVVGAVVALVGPARARLVGAALAAATLLGWAATRLDVLTHAVVPTSLPPAVDRGTTVLAAALGAAGAIALVVRSSRRA